MGETDDGIRVGAAATIARRLAAPSHLTCASRYDPVGAGGNMESLPCNDFRREQRSGERRADRRDVGPRRRRPATQQIPLGVPRPGAVSWVGIVCG